MSSINKPGLVIIYDHFYPAYKAGGPIQSLTNLAISLHEDYMISVFTSSYDLNESKQLEGIITDCWTDVKLPFSDVSIKIWYASKSKTGMLNIREAVRKAEPAFIYLNGMFSFSFVLVPLMLLRGYKILICPRGMLQKGALAGKMLKKKIYLSILINSGLCRKVRWHATNEEEYRDIKKNFGDHVKVIVAGNIPRKPLEKIEPCRKLPGYLRLVYLSLITAKKNLLQLVNIISTIDENITLDIYGPVKDDAYWQQCLNTINNCSGKIKYKGNIQPVLVQKTISEYDAFIMLTKGENFGHALYESFSTGRPVITSYFTPWNNLAEKKAGWNVDISDTDEIVSVLKKICNMDQAAFADFNDGSFNLANDYYRNGFEIGSYKMLFSNL